MNIKKIGLTALATTLVAGSAYAAEVSVSGGAGFTFVTQTGNTGSATDNGKGFGTDHALGFSTSGEMDNGWSVSAATNFTDAGAMSTSAVSVTMGSMGTFKSGYSFGGHAGSYDGLAGAYEEVDDGAGTGLSSNAMGSQFDNGSIAYAAPAIEAAGATIQIHLGYALTGNDVALAGGVADGTATFGSARFAGVTISHDSGLTLGIAGQEADRNRISSVNSHDVFAGNWYATYSMGPVSIGYMQGYTDMGNVNAAAASASSQKTLAAADGIFTDEQYVIAFNINDNLSVSYAKAEDTYDAQAGSTANSVAGSTVADVTVDHKSIQLAYSMGSMSIKAYRQETDNVGYDSDGGSHTKNEIALGLTF